MRYHRENDSVKSQSCEVTGGELTLAVDQLTILYNKQECISGRWGKLSFLAQYES